VCGRGEQVGITRIHGAIEAADLMYLARLDECEGRMSGVFEKMIKPSLDCIPVLEVIHSEWHNGVKFRITQTVNRNIFNEFDHKLSHHLAAMTGTGFPNCKVTIQIVDLHKKGEPHYLEPTYHDSAPHALKAAAERAFARVGPIELVLQRGDCDPGQMLPVYHKRKIDGAYIAQFEQALGICNHLGATAFLDLSGEFDIVEVTPPGGLDPVVLNLQDGTVLVPSLHGPTKKPFEWPIYAFAEHASNNISAQSYVASVRHAIVTEKEAAILAFRSAAEQQIHEFDSALAGRRLDGHWLKGASVLIARLRAGLGETLAGISEGARGKALNWCMEIRNGRKANPAAAKRVTNGPSGAARIRAAV
jgi:hypothetical protein